MNVAQYVKSRAWQGKPHSPSIHVRKCIQQTSPRIAIFATSMGSSRFISVRTAHVHRHS